MSAIALIAPVPTPTVYGSGAALDSPTAALVGYSVQRLPTDTIGDFVLTLQNLVVGSAVQIETTTGVALLNTVATAVDQSFTVSAYVAGSPLNNLRIKVRKGSSAPFFQPWETLTTAFAGSASIFVSQISDE